VRTCETRALPAAVKRNSPILRRSVSVRAACRHDSGRGGLRLNLPIVAMRSGGSCALVLASALGAQPLLSGGSRLAEAQRGCSSSRRRIVVPGPGIALATSRLPGFSSACRPNRAAAHRITALSRDGRGALPEVLRPSWFILLVPPSLIYARRGAVVLFSRRSCISSAWSSPSPPGLRGNFWRWRSRRPVGVTFRSTLGLRCRALRAEHPSISGRRSPPRLPWRRFLWWLFS